MSTTIYHEFRHVQEGCIGAKQEEEYTIWLDCYDIANKILTFTTI